MPHPFQNYMHIKKSPSPKSSKLPFLLAGDPGSRANLNQNFQVF